jgi:hypothetical protein
MNPDIIKAVPEENYTVRVWFENGESGVFDVKPYLGRGIFMELRDLSIFNSVRPSMGTIQWANEADICPDTVYLDSVKS